MTRDRKEKGKTCHIIKREFHRQWLLHLMLLPMVILLLIFSYYPMIGIVIAFEKYNPRLGFFKSSWIGWDNFRYILKMPNTFRVLFNTIYIALLKMLFGLLVPILFAVLLDLVKHNGYKRIIQTLIYIPYFLSWVVLSGILIDTLSPSMGIINQILKSLGIQPIFFLGNAQIFP
ncbi:MAG: sugar ABC transporter permease, partial [Acetatifactor sp.]|nr:sugar ABC transporter permease [Acetatifactor sp.]